MHSNRSLQLHNDSIYEITDSIKYQSRLVNWEDYTVGAYLGIVCILAVALNTLVIYTCIRNWSSLVMSDYYILNLACSDIILPISGFPLAISSSFSHKWLFGDIGCTLYGFLGFFFGLSSITTLTVMGITRYVTICHPQKDVSNITVTRRLIVFVYLYALVWSLIPLSGWGSYSVEAYGTSCTLQWNHNRSFITLMAFFCILMPSVVMMVTYGFILLKCHRSSKSLTIWRQDQPKKLPRKETYLVKMTFAMCWGFLVSWMPYGVVSMWAAYGNPDLLPNRVIVLAVLCAKSSTVVNPVIYFLLSKKLRPLMTESFKFQWLCCSNLTGGGNESSNVVIHSCALVDTSTSSGQRICTFKSVYSDRTMCENEACV